MEEITNWEEILQHMLLTKDYYPKVQIIKKTQHNLKAYAKDYRNFQEEGTVGPNKHMIIISTSLETKEVSTTNKKQDKVFYTQISKNKNVQQSAKITENMKWQDELLSAGV